VEFFAAGLRECIRKFDRLLIRGRIGSKRRRLLAAETELGLLGWQQVGFSPAIQSEVDKAQSVEREQLRLTNAHAELNLHFYE
jgi:hypothetical protein